MRSEIPLFQTPDLQFDRQVQFETNKAMCSENRNKERERERERKIEKDGEQYDRKYKRCANELCPPLLTPTTNPFAHFTTVLYLHIIT